jgi:hypothetical protein
MLASGFLSLFRVTVKGIEKYPAFCPIRADFCAKFTAEFYLGNTELSAKT